MKWRMQRWLRSPAAGRDVLGEYRDRIMLPMAVASVLLLLPFIVIDAITGKWLMACMAFAVMLPLAIDAFALRRRRRPPVAYGWMLVPIAVAIATVLVEHGMYGAMWCYPAILFCYFVLPGWQATAGATGLLVMTTVLLAIFIGMPTALRFAVTSALSIVILNIILGVVGELQHKLYQQATTDPLTGALNRRQMRVLLSDAIEQARRTDGPVSLLAFDLDHFKQVNDRFGHAVGDETLQRVVALVHERVRRIDRLFRMGGEEFALLLPATGEADAAGFAELLRERIAAAGGPPGVAVTVSLGVAAYRPEQTLDAWMKAADDALYQAKADGRDRVRTAAATPAKPAVAEPAPQGEAPAAAAA